MLPQDPQLGFRGDEILAWPSLRILRRFLGMFPDKGLED